MQTTIFKAAQAPTGAVVPRTASQVSFLTSVPSGRSSPHTYLPYREVEYGGVQGCPPGNQSFCCYGDYEEGEWPGRNNGCNCSDSAVVFSLPPAYPALATIPASLGSSTTTSKPSTTGTSATTVSSGFEPTQSSSSDKSGNSGEGISLGIGLGVGIPLTLAAMGIIWLWNRRRNRKAATRPFPSAPAAILLREDENEVQWQRDQPAGELQGEGGSRLQQKRGELYGSVAKLSRHELDGDTRL